MIYELASRLTVKGGNAASATNYRFLKVISVRLRQYVDGERESSAGGWFLISRGGFRTSRASHLLGAGERRRAGEYR